MKKGLFLAILAALLVILSGCCARGSGSGWGRTIPLPPILTVVLTNNTTVPVEVYENGQPVAFKDKAGNWHKMILAPGGVVSRGYYNYLGRRDVIITVMGICPETADTKAAGCIPGQHAGTGTRSFQIYSDGRYRTHHWEINSLRGPRGVH